VVISCYESIYLEAFTCKMTNLIGNFISIERHLCPYCHCSGEIVPKNSLKPIHLKTPAGLGRVWLSVGTFV
jgi:hypothetical protein